MGPGCHSAGLPLRLFLLALLLVPAAATAQAALAFGPAMPFPAPGVPGRIEAVDVDGDGGGDLVLGSGTAVLVLWNDGQGQFLERTEIPFEARVADVLTADLDGDGGLDVVAALPGDAVDGAGSGVGVALLTSGRQVRHIEVLPVAGHPYRLATGDFDSDGRIDVAWTDEGATAVGLLRGDGDGLSPWVELSLEAGADVPPADLQDGDLAAGDVDGDGDPDLALAGWSAPASPWRLLVNPGDGSAAWETVPQTPVWFTTEVEMADLNGDGDPELVGAAMSYPVIVWPGTGTDTFGEAQRQPRESWEQGSFEACLADLDGDGWLDVATTDRDGPLRLFLNDGAGALLRSPTVVEGAARRGSLACGDLDADGDVELVTTDPGGARVEVRQGLLYAEHDYPPQLRLTRGSGSFGRRGFGGDTLTLDASASLDPEARPLTFGWRQLAGTPVMLSDDGPTPSFVAPQVFDSLAFEARVADAANVSDADTLGFRIRPTYFGEPAAARTARWQRVAQVHGRVEDVAFAPGGNRVAWAVTSDYDSREPWLEWSDFQVGVWRSGDGGASWVPSAAGIGPVDGQIGYGWGPARLVVASPETLFTTAGHVLHRSVDGGVTWRRLPAIEPGRLTNAAWIGGRLYVTGQEYMGLVVSDDAGETFRSANRNLPKTDVGSHAVVFAVAADPFARDMMYAVGGYSGLYRTEAGAPWVSVGLTRSDELFVSPHSGWLYQATLFRDEGFLFRSQRLGAAFETIESGLRQIPARPVDGSPSTFTMRIPLDHHVVAFDPVEPLTVYLGTVAGVYRSLDGGDHWARLEGSPDEAVLSVAAAPGEPRVLLAGTDRGRIWRAELTSGGTPTAVEEPTVADPVAQRLAPAYPNPFNAGTVIEYRLAERGPVSLAVYDIAGQRVRALDRAEHAAGRYRVVWDGRDDDGRTVATGVYLCRLETGSGVETRSLVLLR